MPLDMEPLLESTQPLVRQEFETVEFIRREAIPPDEESAALFQHALSTSLVAVPRSIGDQYRAPSANTANRLRQRLFVILGIMERSVEHHQVKLGIGKRQVIELRLKPRKQRRQSRLVMFCCAKTITLVDE